jgi:hypothetical protein
MNIILRLAMWAAILVSVSEGRRRTPALQRASRGRNPARWGIGERVMPIVSELRSLAPGQRNAVIAGLLASANVTLRACLA